MKNKKKIELMAPAGSFPALVAACKAGADAIYLGIDDFSMRSGKRNFNVSDLDKIRKTRDSYPRKPKIYLTLNTIVYNSELKKLESLIKKVKNKVDAVICWDLSVIQECKKEKVPFFISTQASVANKKAAEFYKKLGAQRIVLARELDLKQIKEITKIKNLEIEVFIHGAMCVSVSGRCFTSQFLFNKSANRGECFHPCRRSYIVKDEKYGHELRLENNKVMSAKDLCTLPFIEEIKKTGVDSFKIEGRNRDPRYVETVTRIYREAIDRKLSNKEIKSYLEELKDVYNREFSSGFYLGKPLADSFSSVENSAAKKKREYIGKIVHLYPKQEVSVIKLVKDLKLLDEIIVINDDIGLERHQVNQMEINKKKIKRASKGDEVAIKFPFRAIKGSEIYKIKYK